MTTLLLFVGALALSVFVFEISSSILAAASTFGKNRLDAVADRESGTRMPTRRTTWEAILIAIFPGRFDASKAKNSANVVDLLRRSGYPVDTPGEFYAGAIRTFSMFLLVGGAAAGLLATTEFGFLGPVVAGAMILVGLRRPYSRLKLLAKKRAETVKSNMLIGLSVLDALLTAGVATQEALRRTAAVGGPFNNLLALLVARMEIEPVDKAIATTRAHVPDPYDVEMDLFLRDVEDYFVSNRPLASSVRALREAVHRAVVEATEARAALVKQRAGLFGVLSVLGLVLGLIAPYMGQGMG